MVTIAKEYTPGSSVSNIQSIVRVATSQLDRRHNRSARGAPSSNLLVIGDRPCGAHDKTAADIDAATAQRSASWFFFAEAKAGLLEGQIQDLDTERAVVLATRQQLDDRLAELREKESSLNLQRAGHGGNRIRRISRTA
jgi:hypothetical protein